MEIQNAIFKWLKASSVVVNSKLPFEFNKLQAGKSCLSMQTMQAEKVLSEDIVGNKTIQYSFMLILREAPNTSQKNINTELLLDSIGSWVDNQTQYPAMDSNQNITKVKQTTNTAIITKYDDGFSDYNCMFEVNYKIKGD